MQISKPIMIRISHDVVVTFLDCFFYTNHDGQQQQVDYIIENTTKDDTVVGTVLWENRSVHAWQQAMENLAHNRRLVVIADSVYSDCYKPDLPVCFIDFFLLRTYFETQVKKSLPTSQVWNPCTKSFLFLTGKPDGVHRAGLLKQIIDAGLEKNCVWSLFISDQQASKVQKLLGQSAQDFQVFRNTYCRSPDNINPNDVVKQGNIHYGGFPYDVALFQNTSFRLISETQFTSTGPWVTEKTWTTIANRHPFIMASNVGTLDKLQRLGIKTFENYLPRSDYDQISDTQLRLDALIENTKFWVDNIHTQENVIHADLDHNLKIYNELITKNIQTMQVLCKNLKLDPESFLRLLPIDNVIENKWNTFYNSIRDPSWPDCWDEKDFVTLPIQIQQECIQVHNYKPSVDKP